MPSSPATHTRAQADPSPSAPAPPDPTHLPRPDTVDPDLYLVLAHHVGGDPELHLARTQMVQTLAWCHGRPYPRCLAKTFSWCATAPRPSPMPASGLL